MENYQPIAQEVVIVFEDGRTGVFFGPVVVDDNMKESGVRVKEIYFIDLVSPPPPPKEQVIDIKSIPDIEAVNGPVNGGE